MNAAPLTIIVIHPKEKRKKCSVEPLRQRSDFVFWKYPHRGETSLEHYVRLGFNGPLLSRADHAKGLLLLDGTWKLAGQMEVDYQDVLIRSLDPRWQTAYPRVSKIYADPSRGLATIEALFAAYIQIGKDTTDLLNNYYWAEDFLTLNSGLLEEYQNISSTRK